MAKFYLDASLFLLPSSNEIFGMVVLELLFFGTPVFSTPEAGPKDILQYQDNLSRCFSLDLESWKNEIINFILSTNMENRILRHNYIQCHFNWASIAEEYIGKIIDN